MKISELDKKTKIYLLNAIRNGEVDPKELTKESIIISDANDCFAGLMVSVSQRKASKKSTVVFIGEAKLSMDKTLENIMKARAISKVE
jgi:hypothetical protein